MEFSRILFQTLSESGNSCIAIIGGGGKTTLLHILANEFAKYHSQVIISSLTKAGLSPIHPVHFFQEFTHPESQPSLLKNNPLYIMGDRINDQKLQGIDAPELLELYQTSDLTIFECDGARKRPIKAHQPFDPAVPGFATHVIIVVGADAVGAKIEGKFVHRPELFRELWNVNANFELDSSFIAKVLTSRYGYLQKVPSNVEIAYFVNKADLFPSEALLLAQAISRVSNANVFYGSLKAGQLEHIH